MFDRLHNTHRFIPLMVVLVASWAVWGLLFVVLPPSQQEFPLNDDWAYSKGAFGFARDGTIRYFRQGSMPLLGQWLLSWPMIRIGGASHVVLRATTITLSWLAALAFYDILIRWSRLARFEAAFASAVLLFNPLVFLTTGTFMSDVPALSLSLLALDAYAHALASDRPGWSVLALLAATLAVITRQNAVVVPITAGLLMMRTGRSGSRWDRIIAIVLPVLIGALVHAWFSKRPDAVPLGPVLPTGKGTFLLIFAGLIYLGLSILPVLAMRPGIRDVRWFGAALLALAVGVWFCRTRGATLFPAYAYHGGLFPYLENMVTPWGTFESGNYVVGVRPLIISRSWQWFLTLAGCLGGAALVDRVISVWGRCILESPLALYTILQACLLLVSPTLYDRYLIVLAPGAIAAVSAVAFPRRRLIGLGTLALVAVCAVGLMHDWLAWNSARWALGRQALTMGISASDIEGGLEWDGWYAPGDVAPEGPMTPPRGLTLPFNRRRFPHLTGRYALSFSRRNGTDVLASRPYDLWLNPSHQMFFLLTRR